jgi:colanic acid biosynthesis glycosyl transferase WcaI
VRVVFLNRYFFPDHSATSQLLTDLSFYLAGRGHEVHIIASRQLYDAPDAKLTGYEVVQGVYVHRVWTSRFGRKKLLGRSADYLSFYLTAAFKLYWVSDSHTVVVAKTDPPLISIPVSMVVVLRRSCLVNWLQDVFPEVAVELGVKALAGKIGVWVRALRNASLRAARMSVVIGEGMAHRIQSCGVDADNIRVIANWVDGQAITPVLPNSNSLRLNWGLSGKFVVMYSGNMGRAHEFETILDAAALLQSDARFVFLFVGGGNQLGPLGSAVTSRGLNNVQFKPYQAREQLGLSLSVGEVHLISLRPELEGLIVPSKFYGILAAGRPVVFIGAVDGELALQITRADCGLVVKQGDAKGLADGLVRLAGSSDVCERMGQNGRRLFDAKLNQTQSMADWEKTLEYTLQKFTC